MKHYGYVVIKFPVNDGKRMDYSHKMMHNHVIMEILNAMDPSFKYVGSLNTSPSVGEMEIDLLFSELCCMRGVRNLQKVTKYITKFNKTNPLPSGVMNG